MRRFINVPVDGRTYHTYAADAAHSGPLKVTEITRPSSARGISAGVNTPWRGPGLPGYHAPVRTHPQKPGLTFGEFIAGAYSVCGGRKAKGFVRLAVNAQFVEFRGDRRYVILDPSRDEPHDPVHPLREGPTRRSSKDGPS